ncbi:MULTISPECIES: DUF4240 domain-containing protein [Nonomuraea]|uniref:DUF4240 domain-containing protein n=1 Tax=Nonomuraea mangrovi TaxID=2316207 RepID=A0ABW4T484_9ACTN
MNQYEFWHLIETAQMESESSEAFADRLTEMMIAVSAEEILDFYEHLSDLCSSAYRCDLWGAAALIYEGYCGDDPFLYFRLWLVAQGKAVYGSALASPDSLAEHRPIQVMAAKPMSDWDEGSEWPWLESLLYVAPNAYEHKTGMTFDDAIDARRPDVLRSVSEGDPVGEAWDLSNREEIQRRAPRLAALFLHKVK